MRLSQDDHPGMKYFEVKLRKAYNLFCSVLRKSKHIFSYSICFWSCLIQCFSGYCFTNSLIVCYISPTFWFDLIIDMEIWRYDCEHRLGILSNICRAATPNWWSSSLHILLVSQLCFGSWARIPWANPRDPAKYTISSWRWWYIHI